MRSQQQNNSGGGKIENFQRISKTSKLVFTLFGVVQFISCMLLGWKAYDPEAWLPMPPVSTFVAVEFMFIIVWFLWLKGIDVIDTDEKKPGPPSR